MKQVTKQGQKRLLRLNQHKPLEMVKHPQIILGQTTKKITWLTNTHECYQALAKTDKNRQKRCTVLFEKQTERTASPPARSGDRKSKDYLTAKKNQML